MLVHGKFVEGLTVNIGAHIAAAATADDMQVSDAVKDQLARSYSVRPPRLHTKRCQENGVFFNSVDGYPASTYIRHKDRIG
jgi:hypothetical protein